MDSIILTTTTADLAGVVALRLDRDRSEFDGTSRRVNRTATLDGGVVVTDSGFAHGDRTLTLTGREVSPAQQTSLRTLQQNNAILHLALEDGFFAVAMARRQPDGDRVSLTLLVQSRLSA